MGCDIHLFVEKKFYRDFNEGCENSFWLSIDKWTKNPDTKAYPEWNAPEWSIEIGDEMFSERNYTLFAILAGVRNHINIIPIAVPKGLPEDVTKEIKILSDEEGRDGHSHSWLTLRELIEFNWNNTFSYNGKLFTYKECCKEFVEKFMPKLSSYGKPEEIRIVFWFDN